MSACCEVSVAFCAREGCEWLDRVFTGPVQSSFFIDGTTQLPPGSISLALRVLRPERSTVVPQPPELSPAPPIPMLPPPRDGSTNAAFRPPRQPDSSAAGNTVSVRRSGPTATRWLSSPAHSQPLSLAGTRQLSGPAISQKVSPALGQYKTILLSDHK